MNVTQLEARRHLAQKGQGRDTGPKVSTRDLDQKMKAEFGNRIHDDRGEPRTVTEALDRKFKESFQSRP